MDGAKAQRGPAKLEHDRRLSLEMAHVRVARRSPAHHVDGERVLVARGRVWRDADKHAVINVIIVGAFELSGAVLKGEGHLRLSQHGEGKRMVDGVGGAETTLTAPALYAVPAGGDTVGTRRVLLPHPGRKVTDCLRHCGKKRANMRSSPYPGRGVVSSTIDAIKWTKGTGVSERDGPQDICGTKIARSSDTRCTKPGCADSWNAA